MSAWVGVVLAQKQDVLWLDVQVGFNFGEKAFLVQGVAVPLVEDWLSNVGRHSPSRYHMDDLGRNQSHNGDQ